MKKYFIYFFIVLCVYYSCTSSFKMGLYNGKNNSGNANEFTFSEDSTFTYDYYGLIRKHSSGKYKIKDDGIILNSSVKDITVPVKISVLLCDSLTGKNKITVLFNLPEEEQKNYRCILIINKDTLNNNEDALKLYITQDIWMDDEWGTYTGYYSKPIDSIRLTVMRIPFLSPPGILIEPMETKTMYFDKVIGKDITINLTINDSLFGYKVFDNIVLDIKRKKIIFIDVEEIKSLESSRAMSQKWTRMIRPLMST
ncbi:hypothetical protein [Dysgonomonas reticulitermitis]